MKLSIKAMAITSGILWGGCMLTFGVANLSSPSYGRTFLRVMSSIYPGFHDSRTVPDVLVGAGYGFVDGAAGLPRRCRMTNGTCRTFLAFSASGPTREANAREILLIDAQDEFVNPSRVFPAETI